jgi:hypothetical protein
MVPYNCMRKVRHNEELAVRKKEVDYSKIYKKLTPAQRRARLNWKKKQYHTDSEYRQKSKQQSSNWRKNRTPEQIEGQKIRGKIYNRDYKRNSSKKFEETGNLKIYFQFKRKKIQSSARKRKLDFNLTVQDMIDIYKEQNGKCYYTNEPMVLKIYSGKLLNTETLHEFRPYLTADRTDPKKGYIKGNVHFTTFKFNSMKSDMSEEKLLETAKLIVKKLDKKQL